MNKIIIFKEKHCERYFYASTPEDLCKIAIKIFKERVVEDYWYEFETETPTKPEIAEEDANSLRSSLKNIVLQEWRNYRHALRYYEETVKDKKLYDAALKDESGTIVLKFLKSRRNCEYEGFEMVEPEKF